MNKAYKYRLYPTPKQENLINQTIGACRFVYNQALNWRISAYKADKTSLSYVDTTYGLTKIKSIYPWLKDVDSVALQQALRHLDTAYKNFFTVRKTGFPKFKSKKHGRKSYSTININNNICVMDKAVKLPKLGKVKAAISRIAPDDWTLKSATISQESDGSYYVSILYEYDIVIPPVKPETAIGFDYKSDGLYMASDGSFCDMPKFYRQSQKQLAKAQRKLKHKTIGSNNYKKQQRNIAKIHRHVANQRNDFLHKISTEIANRYDCVCVESLDMKAMSNKSFGNGKATMDNSYGMFLSMLNYKLTDRGKQLVKIDKWFPSSQLCSCCGHKQKLKLSDRVYRCPNCSNVMNRDYNAAINILNEGLRLIG